MAETAEINRFSGCEQAGPISQKVKIYRAFPDKIFIIGFSLVVLTSYEIRNPVSGR
ncbi:hypothetical protein [Haladaptatus sp. NG-WS-4]